MEKPTTKKKASANVLEESAEAPLLCKKKNTMPTREKRDLPETDGARYGGRLPLPEQGPA